MLIVLTAFYNAETYLPKCIQSLTEQTVPFLCYLIDDLSTDYSVKVAADLTEDDPRFILLQNQTKQWQPGNYEQVIQRLHANDVCVTLDGDDWFPDANVLQRVRDVYRDPAVWITWGSFWHLRGGRLQHGLSCNVADVAQQRHAIWHTSHLRTWRAFLWQAIRKEDLRAPDGQYWEAAGDLAFMYPMLEMATNAHARFLPEYNYVYNHDNPLCDSIAKGGLQKRYEGLIRNMPPYQPLVRT